MIHSSIYQLLTIITVASVLTSCVPGKKEGRPSPYASDSTTIGNARLAISYSSPGVKKRKIWGELVPYGNIWRTGANEASTFSASADILINDKLLPQGKYSVFTIPDSRSWVIIFNSDWDQWGAYNYDENKDQRRIEVTPTETKDHQERMKFTFADNQLVFHWEYLTFRLDIDTP